MLDLLAEAMVEAIYGGKAKGFMLDIIIEHLNNYRDMIQKRVANFDML